VYAIYSTSEIAKKAGVHPNTVRWYEEMGYLPPVARKENGYRIFTDEHVEQLKLIKTAFRCEILQSNLREKATEIILLCAKGKYVEALENAKIYHSAICTEKEKAEEAVGLVCNFINHQEDNQSSLTLKRNETAKHLDITIDALRNWELNGLIEVPRKDNGYRLYTDKEIKELKIIRVLRNANYSLMAILRMLNQLRSDGNIIEMRHTLDTPSPDEDIVYVTDKLLTSLGNAESDAIEMISHISNLK